jgi:hypothetical protein
VSHDRDHATVTMTSDLGRVFLIGVVSNVAFVALQAVFGIVVPQNVVRREMLARDGRESGHAARCRPLARAPRARPTRVERGIRLRACGARGSYSTPCESQALV